MSHSHSSRTIGPGKTMVNAKVATTDVLAAKARAAKEGRPLSDVVARAIHEYGKGKPTPKEPTPA